MKPTVLEQKRFQKKYKTGPIHECWKWQGSLDQDGYGFFWLRGRNLRAHRVAYLLFRGDPGKMCVCHTCDNPSCVNPDHLWLGTGPENIADRHRKGRSKGNPFKPGHKTWNKGTRGMCKPNSGSFKKGTPNLNRALKDEDFPVIRDLLGQKVPVKEIARQFDVSFQLIYAVKYGKRYVKV